MKFYIFCNIIIIINYICNNNHNNLYLTTKYSVYVSVTRITIKNADSFKKKKKTVAVLVFLPRLFDPQIT